MSHKLDNLLDVNYDDIDIPSNAGFILRGKSVLPEEAKEVIRRCDYFFNRPIQSGIDKYKDWNFIDNKNPIAKNIKAWQRQWQVFSCNFLPIRMIKNPAYAVSWISPDGQIFMNYKFGEKKTATKIMKELNSLTRTFKFLDLELSIFNGTTHLLTITSKGGKSTGLIPDQPDSGNRLFTEHEDLNLTVPPEWIQEWKELSQKVKI